jgi:hypothetical protein
VLVALKNSLNWTYICTLLVFAFIQIHTFVIGFDSLMNNWFHVKIDRWFLIMMT